MHLCPLSAAVEPGCARDLGYWCVPAKPLPRGRSLSHEGSFCRERTRDSSTSSCLAVVPPLLCGCFGLAGHSSLPPAPFVVSLGVIRTKRGSGGCRGSTAGWEGAHGQDDPVGRMTIGAVGPAVPGQVESLHTFLPTPLLAPALSPTAVSWLAVPLLARGAGTPRKGDGASSSQHKDSHGLEQGSPCLPGVPPAPGGRAVRRSHKQTKKNPEYFRKVFFFPLHPYFQSSSHVSGQPAELLSGPVSPCPAP